MTDRIDTAPRWRIALLALLSVTGFWALAGRLHTLQVVENRSYEGFLRRQSVRRVLLPAPRGRIFDRNGVRLADNRPSYCIAVFVEELRRPGAWSNTINRVDGEIDAMASRLGIPRQISREDIRRHVMRRLPLPLLAWQDLDEATVARFSELVTPDLGMDLYVQPERVYPQGTLAAHLLGYIGRESPSAATNGLPFHYNVLVMKGRSGIEASCDALLAGEPGGRLITVDVSGYRHSETNRPAIPGTDISLTIDAGLQGTMERLLAGHRAAGVAVDPRNGDVLALASQPEFDPNVMSPAVPRAYWRELQSNPDRPLLNRAVSGRYPPGSVFKPCVALAALAEGVPPTVTYPCDGAFRLGNMTLHCSKRAGHGEAVGIRYAIEQSCNPFFCALGSRIGLDAIRREAAAFGFGRRTGIGIGGEAAGLLPDDAWKRCVYKDGWRAGDTAALSIGQSFLLVTPLQVAMYAAALANGGRLYAPRLVREPSENVGGTLVRDLAVPASQMRLVRGAMRDVVAAEQGSGRRARVYGLDIAAKTGTAEYGSRANRRKHTWMIAFAPFENPEIALAVVVEDGDSGGKTVAPIIRELLRSYFADRLPAEPEGFAPEPPAQEEAPAAPEPAPRPADGGLGEAALPPPAPPAQPVPAGVRGLAPAPLAPVAPTAPAPAPLVPADIEIVPAPEPRAIPQAGIRNSEFEILPPARPPSFVLHPSSFPLRTSPSFVLRPSYFVLRTSLPIRHSSFVIRHSNRGGAA